MHTEGRGGGGVGGGRGGSDGGEQNVVFHYEVHEHVVDLVMYGHAGVVFGFVSVGGVSAGSMRSARGGVNEREICR